MTTSPPSPRQGRDGGLDLLRGLALVRVVIWHATGAAVVTLLAAMPVMFFVSGELFSASAARRGALVTVKERLRRLGPPLWLFAAGAWIAMAVGALVTGTALDLGRLPLWLLPVSDPQGSTWEGGWLATPLWYLRALLWVLLLAPLLVRAVRRAPRTLLAVGAAAVGGLEWAERHVAWSPAAAPRLLWQLGDLALYGTFFAAGMWIHRRGPATARSALTVATLAATAAVAWWWISPPPGGVVNDSHVTHLLFGVTIVAVTTAARPTLAAVARHRLVAPGVHLLGQRALTIYLWHTAAIAVALWVVNRSPWLTGPSRALAYTTLIVAGVVAAVAATGWLEDLAARRRPTVWPVLRAPAGHGCRTSGPRWRVVLVPALGALVVAAAVPLAAQRGSGTAALAVRVPSQAPPRPTFGPASDVAHEPVPAGDLDALLTGWADDHGITGSVVAVGRPGQPTWSGATGASWSGTARSVDETIDIASVTKLYTANLVYRAVDAGLVSLDDPLPDVPGVPAELTRELTVRALLSHRSGLTNYRDSAAYQADPKVVDGPLAALTVSLPPDGEPLAIGVPHYSSTNYLVLGYVLERATGVAFEDLLRTWLLEPVGLGRTSHLAPEPGEPRFATAGIVADIADLAHAGTALLVDHVGMSDASWQEMAAVDPEAGMGAGTLQFCPCGLDADGRPEAFAIGYASGNTMLVRLTGIDTIVALDLTDPFYGDDGRFDDVLTLLRGIEGLLAGGEETAPPGDGTTTA